MSGPRNMSRPSRAGPIMDWVAIACLAGVFLEGSFSAEKLAAFAHQLAAYFFLVPTGRQLAAQRLARRHSFPNSPLFACGHHVLPGRAHRGHHAQTQALYLDAGVFLLIPGPGINACFLHRSGHDRRHSPDARRSLADQRRGHLRRPQRHRHKHGAHDGVSAARLS